MTLLLLLLSSFAIAGPCPAHASAAGVTIDGITYNATGPNRRAEIAARLEAGGCDVAAFEDWRRQIRLSRGTAAAGVLFAWPVLIATAVHVSKAAQARRRILAPVGKGAV